MDYKLKYSPKSLRSLKKLDLINKEKITAKVSLLVKIYPDIKELDIKKLKDKDEYRLRVGDYRVFFEFFNNIIHIIDVMHRKDAYKNK